MNSHRAPSEFTSIALSDFASIALSECTPQQRSHWFVDRWRGEVPWKGAPAGLVGGVDVRHGTACESEQQRVVILVLDEGQSQLLQGSMW